MAQLTDQSYHFYQLCLQALQILVVFFGFVMSIRQFRIQARAHLLSVYQQVFKMIDDIREERHYVADEVDRFKTFETEKWLDRSQCSQNEQWKRHYESAEKVFRNFDQLGLLVREGRVPLNAITRFYVRPILQAWYKLGPYVRAVRKSRPQPSHGWEFENLVYKIIIPGMAANRGPWSGVRAHDFQSGVASEWLQTIREEGPDRCGDLDYAPPIRLWRMPRR